jgi:uncharacterized protein (TIGR04255 family)
MMAKILKNKPLVEAVLEIRWRVPPQTNPPSVNPDSKLFVGRFHDRVVELYPVFEPLQAASLPDEMVPYVAQYRFRAKENDWPLLQIGSGLLTLNATDSYVWNDFEQRAHWAFEMLLKTYPGKLEFESIILHYIDSFSIDFSKQDMLTFMREKLKVSVTFPETLFVGSHIENSPSAFVLQSSFKSKSPLGTVTVKFGRGLVKEKEAFILETFVSSSKEELPELAKEFSSWLIHAHTITDDWFFKLIDGELLHQFE